MGLLPTPILIYLPQDPSWAGKPWAGQAWSLILEPGSARSLQKCPELGEGGAQLQAAAVWTAQLLVLP